MQKVPASVPKVVDAPSFEFASCGWHAFPETSTSLLPSIRLIDCEVENELDPEDVEFEFFQKGGEVFGKHTKNLISEISLVTNKFGTNYCVHYSVADEGKMKLLGRWCFWRDGSDSVPTMEELLPDELNAVHVSSDGGMVYRAWWEKGKQPRGLAIILCGLGGLSYSSDTLGRTLIRDGWAVAFVFTVLNIPDYKLNVKLEGENIAAAAIEVFENKFCQVITGTKAIKEQMNKFLPSLQNAPLVLVGISAGALNVPAVYDELKDEIDAVVLVAGGANMFEIVQDGVFTNWKFTDEKEDRFTASELQEIEAEYLAIPSRDPYFLAQALPLNNTLIIHAKWDAVVPAKNGDLLWERAGKPERWIYPSGHLGLFASFAWHAEDIAKWLDAKTNQPRGQAKF
jgi:hypothetical protein